MKNENSQVTLDKMPLISKLAYSFGDASSTLIHIMIATYLMYFYTDVFGISASAVGTLFLVARIFDALGDPVLGILVDKTKSKFGKCRPWFLGDAIPLGAFAILCFATPNLSPLMKLGYAYITYIGLSIANTAIHIPLTAILPSLTGDAQERTVLNAFRMTGGQIAGIISSIITVPLVMFFGGGNEQKGYFGTIIIYGLFATFALVFCFMNLKERIRPREEKSLSLKESFTTLKGNWPWLICFLVNLSNTIIFTARMSGQIYFLKYNLNDMSLMPTVSLTSYASIISILIVPFLNKKLSKKNTFLVGYGIEMLGLLMLQFFGTVSISVLYIGSFLQSLGSGFGAGLLFAMIADTVDYGEWKTGIRSQGFLSAAGSFGEKLGTSLGGAIAGFILAAGAYVADAQVESISALHAISVVYITIPIIFTIISAVLICFYNIDKIHPTIMKELQQRNSNNKNTDTKVTLNV